MTDTVLSKTTQAIEALGPWGQGWDDAIKEAAEVLRKEAAAIRRIHRNSGYPIKGENFAKAFAFEKAADLIEKL